MKTRQILYGFLSFLAYVYSDSLHGRKVYGLGTLARVL